MAKEKSSSLLLALKKKGSVTLDDIYCTLSYNFVEVFVVVRALRKVRKKKNSTWRNVARNITREFFLQLGWQQVAREIASGNSAQIETASS